MIPSSGQMHSDEAVAGIVAATFGLHLEVSARLLLGSTNCRAFLLMEPGSGQRYFLKSFVDYRPLHLCQIAAHVHAELHRRGANVAPLIPTVTDAFFCETPAFKGTLQRWIDGLPLARGDGEACTDLVHSHLELLACAERIDHLSPTLTDLDPVGLWDRPSGFMSLIDRLRAHVHRNQYGSQIDRLLDSLRNEIGRLASQVTWRELKPQYIHGDAAPENAIRSRSELYLVDLDDLRWSYRILDPVRAVVNSALQSDRYPRFNFWPEVLWRGLAAIQDNEHLSEAERSSAGALARLNVVTAVFSETCLDWQILGFDRPTLLSDATELAAVLEQLLEMLSVLSQRC